MSLARNLPTVNLKLSLIVPDVGAPVLILSVVTFIDERNWCCS